MTKRIYDNQEVNCTMYKNDNYAWFKVKFDEDGKANFWINSGNLSSDLDLYIYSRKEKNRKYLLGKSTISPSASDRDDIVRSIEVNADTYYYVYIAKYGDKTVHYKLKAHNYPETTSNNDDKIFDFRIQNILYKNNNDYYVEVNEDTCFSQNEKIEFCVVVKNYNEHSNGPKYKVIVENNKNVELDHDNEPSFEDNDDEMDALLDVRFKNSKTQNLTFKIIPRENGWKSKYPKYNTETRNFKILEPNIGAVLRIKSIEIEDIANIHENTIISVNIKNEGSKNMTDFKIEASEDKSILDSYIENDQPLKPGSSRTINLTVDINKAGWHDIDVKLFDNYSKKLIVSSNINKKWIDFNKEPGILISRTFKKANKKLLSRLLGFNNNTLFNIKAWENILEKTDSNPTAIGNILMRPTVDALYDIFKYLNDFPIYKNIRENSNLNSNDGAIALNISYGGALFVGASGTLSIVVSGQGPVRIYFGVGFSAGLELNIQKGIIPDFSISYFPSLNNLDKLNDCEGLLNIFSNKIHLTSDCFFEVELPSDLDPTNLIEIIELTFGFNYSVPLMQTTLDKLDIKEY